MRRNGLGTSPSQSLARLIPVAALVLLGGVSCDRPKAPVAHVGATWIGQPEWTAYLKDHPDGNLAGLVRQEVAFQLAGKQGLLKGIEWQDFLRISRRAALSQAYLAAQPGHGSFSESQAREAYMASAETRHVSHILCSTQAEAQAALKRVTAGEAFDRVANVVSKDPSVKQNHGDLGWIKREQMVAPFAAAVFAAKSGALCGPFQTEFGWHIAKVQEVRRPDPAEFERTKASLMAGMQEALEAQKRPAALKPLKEEYPLIPDKAMLDIDRTTVIAPGDEERTAGRIAGKTISLRELKLFLSENLKTSGASHGLGPETKGQFMEILADDYRLAAAAEKRGLDKRPEVRAAIWESQRKAASDAFSKTYLGSHRHPPTEGKGACLACHDPHGSDLPKLLKKAEPDLCYGCHTQKDAFQNTHAPVAEGSCTTCHNPHSSQGPALLNTPTVTATCASCHDLADKALQTKHQGAALPNVDCAGCHEPHSSTKKALILEGTHPPFNEGCDTCHAAPGPKGGIVLNDQPPALCITCHDALKAPEGSVQHAPFKAGECFACHRPHASKNEKLLILPNSEVCMTCHEAPALPKDGWAHKPFLEKACRECHSPHYSENKSLLLRKDGALCLTCHQTIAAAVKSTHSHAPAAAGECLTCHEHHVGKFSKGLVSPPQELCITCHDVKDLQAPHKGYPVTAKQCVTCHDPHGSNNGGMLKQTAHPPVAKGACNTCHVPSSPASEKPFSLNTPTPGLCFTCHKNVAAAAQMAHPHPPVAKGQCMACHAPHASNRASLLAANPKDLCLKCHEGLRAEADRAISKHKPVMEGQCPLCHTSHGGDTKGFPRGEVYRLCLGCHKDKSGNHPYANHPTGGIINKYTGKPLTCLSCHKPHFSDKPHLLVISGCNDCHK